MKNCLLFVFTIFSSMIFAQDLSVERIWKNYEFSPKRISGFKSMNDGEHYSSVKDENSIYKYRLNDQNDQGSMILDGSKLIFDGKKITFDDYEFNSDESKILLLTNVESIYRRSYQAIYYLYDLTTQKLMPLDPNHSPQTLAEYSPDGTKVSFIHGNDLYVKTIATGKVEKLTQDGKRNKIINGTTDWVYEEEFSITKAYGWSPDSKYIAFLRFDEKAVPEYSMDMYGGLYPEQYTFKYPKAGEVNSVVTAHCIAVDSKKVQAIQLGSYEYIPRLNWSSKSNQLIVQTMNRHQSELNYWLVDVVKGKVSSKNFFTEKSQTYVEIDDNLLILKDGQSILRTSEENGYRHIFQLDFNGTMKQITSGNWDVIDFLGFDEATQQIYFSSAEKGAIQKSIYAVQLNGSNKKDLTPTLGYNEAEFLNGMKYFVHTYSNANQAPSYSLCKSDGSVVRVLESNQAFMDKLKKERLSTKQFIEINANGVKLNASVILPVGFDPSKKYPMYVNVYGGPGHNEVLNAWDGNDYFFHQLLAQKGYIVFQVDPRGTMYQGAAFKKSTYLQLGKLEIEDVMNAVKEYEKNSFVDASRVGIMGWSYGGFMASLGITKGADVFKMAIAVAPVTNWRYYDNIYTERFMRTPQENAEGYDRNSPINYVDNLKGKYLLVHGAADDNVHFQNTMDMTSALVKANKQFELFVYPNKNHGIYGGNTRNHLFQLMLTFIETNL
ncbi:MAG: S9 family peptidase [Flavobacteriales bacterium]